MFKRKDGKTKLKPKHKHGRSLKFQKKAMQEQTEAEMQLLTSQQKALEAKAAREAKVKSTHAAQIKSLKALYVNTNKRLQRTSNVLKGTRKKLKTSQDQCVQLSSTLDETQEELSDIVQKYDSLMDKYSRLRALARKRKQRSEILKQQWSEKKSLLIEQTEEFSELISFLQNQLMEMQEAVEVTEENGIPNNDDFVLSDKGTFTVGLRGLIMDLQQHNVADSKINLVIGDCMRAFNMSMNEASLPSLRTIGRIGYEAQCLAHVQAARALVEARNAGPLGISHDGSQLAQQKLLTNGLHCRHARLQLDVVPIFNNTAEGQLHGLLYSLDMMSESTLALDTNTAALGVTATAILGRIKIALNDKAATETAYNKKIVQEKAKLLVALSNLKLTDNQETALQIIGTFCFAHHNGGCAASVRKTMRVLIKMITNRVARPFDDRAIEPDEEEEYKKATEDSTEFDLDSSSFPAPKYSDTAFDGIRIFNKLLSAKSDYGFAVADKAKSTMDADTWGMIQKLQRVVGTRETEYLRSSGPILRIRHIVSRWLTNFLLTYKQGAQNTSSTLNKLEMAVLEFLEDEFSAIQLCVNTVLDAALFRPNFNMLKGVHLTCPFDKPPDEKKQESVRPVPMKQSQMVWYAKVLYNLYKECEQDPHLVMTGLAASRLTGSFGWKSRSDLTIAVILYSTAKFLTPNEHGFAMAPCEGQEYADMWAVRIAVASLCGSRQKPNFKDVSNLQFSQLVSYGASRPEAFSLGTHLRLDHVASVTVLAMGGISSCFAGRAEDFLPGGKLVAPDEPTMALLGMMDADSDFSERAFAINDARTKRSRGASASTKSRYTMTVVNNTAGWRAGLEAEDRQQLMTKAIPQARKLQQSTKQHNAEVQEKKKQYLWQIHDQGIEKTRALKQKTVLLLSVPLCTQPAVGQEVFNRLKTKTKQKKWLGVQFQAWKLRIPALSKGGLLRRGAFKGLNEVQLLELLVRVMTDCSEPSQGDAKAQIAEQLEQESKAQVAEQLRATDIDQDDVAVFWHRCERKKGSRHCDKWRLLEAEYDASDGKFMCSRVGQTCADECDACELVQCVCEAD